MELCGPEDSEAYTVAWIAALPHERAAGEAMFDEEYDEAPSNFKKSPGDPNAYSWGKMGRHYVVVAALPAGEYGLASTATVAQGLHSSMPRIRIGLLVGNGAGVREIFDEHGRTVGQRDIRLGDVVVGNPDGALGGVVQVDLVRVKVVGSQEVLEHKGFLNSLPMVLRIALAKLQARYERNGSSIPVILAQAFQNNPAMQAKYRHPCLNRPESERKVDMYSTRDGSKITIEARDVPEIHYGIIASGSTLKKSARHRDAILARLAKENIHPVCFEMEAAGLMNNFPCLVVRGVCDYGDESTNDNWQGYAAAVAAGSAKEFLSCVDEEVQMTQAIREPVLEKRHHDTVRQSFDRIIPDLMQLHDTANLTNLRIAKGALYSSYPKEDSYIRLEGTQTQLLDQIGAWTEDPAGKCIFWLCGMAATGQSTISRTLCNKLRMKGRPMASFFFNHSELERNNARLFFPTIVMQLLDVIPGLKVLVAQALEADSLLCEKNLQTQFENLLLQPLLGVAQDLVLPRLIIVIGALDECIGSIDISTILMLLARLGTRTELRFRTFVTSRSHYPIERAFQGMSADLHHDVRLEHRQFTSTKTLKLEGHDDLVLAVAFSPDGKVVASASKDGTMRLWKASTGEEIQKLLGHDGAVNAVAFSPDNKVIASASGDGTVQLWNASTGEETLKLVGHYD